MSLINLTSIQDGDEADDNLFNSRFAKIVEEINGKLDSDNLADNAVSTPKIANNAVTKPKLEKPHYANLYYSTGGAGGGQVIGASEVRSLYDAADPDNYGMTVVTGASASVTIARAGIYNLSALFCLTDGINTTSFIAWFDISTDGGTTYNRIRFPKLAIELNTDHGVINTTVFLPVGAVLKTTVYNGAGTVRVAAFQNTAEGRRTVGPRFTVSEIR